MKKREPFAVFPDGSNASQWIYPVKERDGKTQQHTRLGYLVCTYPMYVVDSWSILLTLQ